MTSVDEIFKVSFLFSFFNPSPGLNPAVEILITIEYSILAFLANESSTPSKIRVSSVTKQQTHDQTDKTDITLLSAHR